MISVVKCHESYLCRAGAALVAFGLAASLVACASGSSGSTSPPTGTPATNTPASSGGPISVTDFSNATVTVQHPVSRVACVTSTCVGMVKELGSSPWL